MADETSIQDMMRAIHKEFGDCTFIVNVLDEGCSLTLSNYRLNPSSGHRYWAKRVRYGRCKPLTVVEALTDLVDAMRRDKAKEAAEISG